MELAQTKSIRKWIVALSVVIPLAVTLLFGIKIEGVDLSFFCAIIFDIPKVIT